MKKYFPHLKVVLAFAIWSSIGLFVNKSTLTPTQTLWGSSLIAMTITAIVAYKTDRAKDFRLLKPDRFLWLLFITAALQGIVWFEALSKMEIGTAVFIHDLAPVFILLLAPLMIKEHYDRKTFTTVSLGLVGLFILGGGNNLVSSKLFSTGAILALLSAVFLALSSIANKNIANKYSLSFIIFWQMLGQFVFTTPLVLVSKFDFTLFNIFSVIFLGVVGSAIAYYFYIQGFRHLKSLTVVLLGYVEPFLAALWGALFLSQPVTLAMIAGGILILTSNYFIVKKQV